MGPAGRCCKKLSPVDLVLVEGFKRDCLPEARNPPRGERQAAAASRGSAHRRHRLRHGRCRSAKVPVVDLNDIEAICRSAAQARRADRQPPRPRCGGRDGAAHRRLLRVLRAAAAGRRHGAADRRARRSRWPKPRTVPLAAARGRVLAADIAAPLDLPPFDNSAVDGYAVRHGDLDAKGETRLTIAGRLTAGSAARRRSTPARRSASSPARRCRPAPTPCSCRRTCAPRATRVIVPAGLKRGANRRLAGEDVRKGVDRAAGRTAARGAGRGARRRGRADQAHGAPARARRAVLDRRRDRRAGHAAAGRRALRRQPLSARRHAGAARRADHRPRHPARTIRTALAERDRSRRARSTTWC